MKTTIIASSLQGLGFDQKEIDIYLACLEIGRSSLLPIARKVSEPRNTVAYTLEKLEERGLLNITKHGTRRHYLIKPPQAIVQLLQTQRDTINNKLQAIETALPQLNNLYTQGSEPVVTTYRGRDEIRTLYEVILDSAVDEIWYVGEYNQIVEIVGENYLKGWIKRRVGKGIATKSIRVRKGEVDDPIYSSPSETNRQIRYSPKDFESPGHITIYGNNVAVITTPKESFAVATASAEYATIMRSWFNQLWKVSKEK
ncbi:MAG: helix-turn-helix domain-containing protein [Patescibacteria group bacterium]